MSMEFFSFKRYQHGIDKIITFLFLSFVSVHLLISQASGRNSFNDSFSAPSSDLNHNMSAEAENLDKCYEIVSDIVEKAGDVRKFAHIFLYLNSCNHK